MGFEIDLGNGNILKDLELKNGQYVSASEISAETFEGAKNVILTTPDGYTKTMKWVNVKYVGLVRGTWRFVLTEKDKDEHREDMRKKKLSEQNKWINESYDRVSATLPKGTKERIKALGYTTNTFINEAVKIMLEANE